MGLGEHSAQYTHKNRLQNLSLQALILMLAIILAPPLFYSINLLRTSTTADEIIVAISIGVFASVVYLWILDATGILPFRSEWVSKTVYGAAIASILGTSGAVYQGYFAVDKHPYRGAWDLTYGKQIYRTSISYSKNAGTYWGFTEVLQGNLADGKRWFKSIEITDFNPEEKIIVIRYTNSSSNEEEKFAVAIKRNGNLIEKESAGGLVLRLKRGN